MRRLRVYTVREARENLFVHNTSLCYDFVPATKILRFEHGCYCCLTYTNRFFVSKNNRFFKRAYVFKNYIDMTVGKYVLSYDNGKVSCTERMVLQKIEEP